MVRTPPSPVTPSGTPRAPGDDRQAIRDLQAYAAAIPRVLPGDPVVSPREDRQQITLGAGPYYPRVFRASTRIDITGGGGSRIVPALSIEAPYVHFRGIRFEGRVFIPATSVVMFDGCELNKEISIEAGGVVHAVLCHFANAGYLNNAGLAAECFATDCHRTSPTPHVNTTVTNETT